MTNRALIATATAPDDSPTSRQRTEVFELRQYILHGGRRDALIELFEREFITPQEQVGAQVLGTFRDHDDPDRFVWLRGFADMSTRAGALSSFYDGPVWAKHRDAANGTMLDSDNVLLLRPDLAERAAFTRLSSPSGGAGVFGLTLHYLGDVDAGAFATFHSRAVSPRVGLAERSILTFSTEKSENDFPRLPIRTKEPVFGWISRWPDIAAMQATWDAMDQASGWRDGADSSVLPALMRKPERLRLVPTSRSAMA